MNSIVNMLPMSRITMLAMLLTVHEVVQCTEGNQRIVHVSELISDDNFSINGHVCCVYGNCTCDSLDNAVANLTSNVLINITTDVMLSSLIKLSDLQNVSIIGHNNTTVNCKHLGGIHLTFCHNCIIQGVTWDGCGTEITSNLTEPGIKLKCSSNVTIQNCSFQHLIGQTLVLSEVSGDVNITNCNFVNNSHYRGHGAAIHYSSMYSAKKSFYDQFVFTLNHCNFTNNRHVTSLVYVENRLFKYHKIIFNNSIFSSNQGIPLYVINHKIYISEEILFQSNIAEDGAGIYISDHSTVIFGKTSNVTFTQNLANVRGGVIFLTNNSTCLFGHNSIVAFYYNQATKGGAIYSEASSNITFNASCKVTFGNNSATQYGATIYSLDYSHIIFTGNTRAIFHNNDVQSKSYSSFGGILYSHNHCGITFEGNTSTIFRNNTTINGGVLYSNHSCYISSEGNSATEFSHNTAWNGGAILSQDNCSISFEGNSTTEFINNTADYGGAILSYDKSYISLLRNSVTKFCGNIAQQGGAMFSLKIIAVYLLM